MGEAPAFDRALVTLMAMLTIQTILNTVGFAVIDPGASARRDPGVAAGAVRRRVQPARFDRLGVGTDTRERRQGSHARPGRTDHRLRRRLRALGERHPRSDYAASALVLIGVVMVTVLG